MRESLVEDFRLDRLQAIAGGLKGKRVLEIGCGCGEFLLAAQVCGASVFGNDISAESCAFVGGKLALPVYEGDFSAAECRRRFGAMDVIVMNDLIEHPPEPLKLIQSALQALNPGGLLLITTPNGGMAGEELQAALTWVGFRVDLEHLQYLSPGTILSLATKYGCRVEHLESFGYPGVAGIDQLPTPVRETVRSRVRGFLREKVRSSREAWRLFSAIRAYGARNPRLGCYHLLAVLRKQARTE